MLFMQWISRACALALSCREMIAMGWFSILKLIIKIQNYCLKLDIVNFKLYFYQVLFDDSTRPKV